VAPIVLRKNVLPRRRYMTKIIVRNSLFLLSSLAFSLFLPALLEAGCNTQCSKGKCSTTLAGADCCCDSTGNAHCGVFDQDPCAASTLLFDATPEDLAAFKDQIDQWYLAGTPELKALGDAASALYTAVLIQDAEGYLKASSEYRKLVASSAQKPSNQEGPGKKPQK
jgi:hypothetical protein